jgi:hypothetical protein
MAFSSFRKLRQTAVAALIVEMKTAVAVWACIVEAAAPVVAVLWVQLHSHHGCVCEPLVPLLKQSFSNERLELPLEIAR